MATLRDAETHLPTHCIQFEKSGAIQTILYDRGDTTRYNTPCMADFCGSTPEEWRANPYCYKYAPLS